VSSALSLPRVLGVAALCLLGACDLEFPEQEVRLRHDAEADTLDVLFVYLGVTTPTSQDEALEKGRAVAERVLGGRREFMLLDWPFNFDLDREYPEGEELAAGVRAAIDRVRLERVGAFLDGEGRLCGYQHFRVDRVSAALAEANRQIDEAALRGLESGELGARELPWFDAGEERAWRDFVASPTPWVSLEEGRLVVRLPVTEEGAARFLEVLAETVREQAGEDPDFTEVLLSNVTGLQVADGVATLRIGSPEGADTALHLSRAVDYSPVLRDQLVAGGLDLSAAPSLAEVRALLDRPR